MRSHAGAASLVVAARSAPLRRAELAWGGLVAAEWAHFVALGVFAYRVGGTSAVGSRAWRGCCPPPCSRRSPVARGSLPSRALLARDRGHRCDGAGGLAARCACGRPLHRRRRGSCRRHLVDALPARAAGALPSLASTPQELVAANSTTSVLESAGTVVGPLAAAALVATAGVSAIFATGAATLVISAVLLGRLHVDPSAPSVRRRAAS